MRKNLLTSLSIFFCGIFSTFSQSPTEPALGFNVFTEGNAVLATNETDGPVAIGGNLDIMGNYQVSTNYTGNFTVNSTIVTLLVNGKVNYNSGTLQVNQNGYVKIGQANGSVVWYYDQNNAASPIRITPTSNYNASSKIMMQANANQLNVGLNNNPVIQSGLIDFAAAFTALKNNSLSISECENNVQLTNPNGNPIPTTNLPNQVKINLVDGINTLNLTMADMNQVSVFTYNQQPSASKVLVINVDGEGEIQWNVWNQAGIGFQQCPYIIYNFYNATTVNIVGNSTIEGTVFAPFANVIKTANQSNIEGQVIARSFTHAGGEVHYAKFTPTLPGCATTPPVFVGTPPTVDFEVNQATQCLNNNEFTFTNNSSVLGCATPFYMESFATSGEVENEFNELYFSAEGRSGNNASNGTFELDIHNVSPYVIKSQGQFVWPNNQNVPFSIVYNPSASGNNKYVYTIGTGSNQKILKFDPTTSGYALDFNGIWYYSRIAANTTLQISNLVIEGEAVSATLGAQNPATDTLENVVFRGGDSFADGFTITGNVKFAWTGTIPQNSAMNFNFKVGNIDCVPTTIVQPNDPITYAWDFGDGTSSTDMSPVKTYTAAGTYDVTLTATNTYGTDSKTTTVTVLAPFTPQITSAVLNSGNGVYEKQFSVTNNVTVESYFWTFHDGSTSTDASPTYSYTEAGFYEVILSVTTANGCANNASVFVVVESTDVNTGNDGGIESESLGDLVSKRYIQRKKNSVPTKFVKSEANVYQKQLIQSNAVSRAGFQSLIDMFPEELMAGDVSHITSPTDILDITTAQEVLSVDYSIDNHTKAVVLGIKTVDRVYNHTKASCDRLRGAEILKVYPIQIDGHNFLTQAIKQRNGVVEYAVSFAVGKNNNDDAYSLQTNWFVNDYTESNEVYNFQVWSTLPEHTFKLVGDILENLEGFIPIVQTEVQKIPHTYAAKITRNGLDLDVKLHSVEKGKAVEIVYEEVRSETNGYGLRYSALSSEASQTIKLAINDNYEYDAVIRVDDQIQDAFYHADGNWGLDFDPRYTTIEQYTVLNDYERVLNPDELPVHRNVILKAFSDYDYISLYKSLLPGNLPDDYTDYGFLAFTAKGSGMMEIGLVKSSIENWSQQYRANVNILEEETTYYIPYRMFASTGTREKIVADDLTTLSFSYFPTVSGNQSLDLKIENVRFTKEAPTGYEELLQIFKDPLYVFPNPTNGLVNCILFSETQSPANLELRDITGKLIYQHSFIIAEGRNDLEFNFQEVVNQGSLLFMSVKSQTTDYGTTKIVIKK
uniref:choice-of-anchor A family protein n=1 Tax=Flavobacterium sp. TaxID=239 RepID=UPI00404B1059